MKFVPTYVLNALTALVIGEPIAAEEPSAESLRSINAALQSWLAAIDSGQTYLLLDSEAAEVRLMQHKALLRSCPANIDSVGNETLEQTMQRRIRRFWRTSASRDGITGSAFDWEDYLAHDGDTDCALWFSSGMIFYASSVWGDLRSPSVRLGGGDLRALFNTSQVGMSLIILPVGWNFTVDNEILSTLAESTR